jgi:hypothetical protein
MSVVLRTTVGLVVRSGERSAPELLVAALEHRDFSDFQGLSSGLQLKVRYEVRVGEGDKAELVLKKSVRMVGRWRRGRFSFGSRLVVIVVGSCQ